MYSPKRKLISYLIIYFILNLSYSFAQVKVKVYYSDQWRAKVKNYFASYYRMGSVADKNTLVFDGEVADYYMSGEMQMTGTYNKGKKTGEFKFYYKSGQLEKQGQYTNNKKSGNWTYYYPNGSLKQIINYTVNDFVVKEYYNEKGKKLIKNATGKWTFYNPYQNLNMTGKFKNGEKVGEWIYKYNFRGEELIVFKEVFENNKFIAGFAYSKLYGEEKVQVERTEKYGLEVIKFKNAEDLHNYENKYEMPPYYFISPGSVSDYYKDKNIGVISDPDEPAVPKVELQSYFKEQLKFPDEALKQKVNGQVQLSFIVTEKGKVENVIIEDSLGYGCDKEAIRLILNTDWLPARICDQLVKSRVELSINFNSNDLHKE